MLVALMCLAGCGEKLKAKIETLEQDKTELLSELDQANQRLAATQQEKAAIQRDRDQLQNVVAADRQTIGELRGRLASRPEPEAVAPGWEAVPGGAMIAIEGTVLFQSGKMALRDESRRTLNAIATTLQSQYAGKDILVLGHTDDRPIRKSGWKDNYELSCQRALAVVRYLQSRSVDPARVIAGGCGEHRPLVANTTAADRQANRRVEIYALDVPLSK